MKPFDHVSGDHLEIDGARIYYEMAGDPGGPPLLFLHGGLSNIEEANSFLPQLATSFLLIGIDSRGQGKSTLGGDVLSYARMQLDVERVLRHLAIDTLSIIGFSDGGITAYRLAAAKNLRVSKLVTIGAQWQLASDDPVRTLYATVTGNSWRKKFPEFFDAYQRLNPEPDFSALVQAASAMWMDTSSDGYPGECVNTIICPSLLVRGDDDKFLSLTAIAELSSRINGSRVLNIPFATHVAFEEQPEILLRSLNDFFARASA